MSSIFDLIYDYKYRAINYIIKINPNFDKYSLETYEIKNILRLMIINDLQNNKILKNGKHIYISLMKQIILKKQLDRIIEYANISIEPFYAGGKITNTILEKKIEFDIINNVPFMNNGKEIVFYLQNKLKELNVIY